MQELNGRNPLYEAQLMPGLRGSATMGDFNFAVGAGVPFNVNGARPQDTLITFDGADAVRTRANGAVIGVANVEAVEEIQVMTADYAPEYGRSSGGQIRIVSKAGTKDFHGGLYEYLKNSAYERQYLVAQHQRSDQLRPAVPLQQLRRHHRRTRLGSRPEPEAARKAVLLRGRRLDPLSV
jgi:hypothetical protein